jgi:hypothetical protein
MIKKTAEMINLEIPDPFTTFRMKKYAEQKGGYRYDFLSGEWDINCGCCNELLTAPTKKTMVKIRLYHTRNECRGGW